MFEASGLKLVTLADLGLRFEAKEDGNTFLHNAEQKATETAAFLKEQAQEAAREYSRFLSPYNIAVLADDSGLVIDALDGEPGVDSALYLGRDTPYREKCQSLIDRLAATPEEKRTARFVCMLVCAMPGGGSLIAEGTVEGRIAHAMSGSDGFGYDPIFYYPPYAKTMAELTQHEKNRVSHRGQAIQKMIGLIVNASSCNK